MVSYDWHWQRLAAESELKDLDGDAFEARFQRIATLAWKNDFTPTIPMGRRGDLKCDGYRLSTRTVYQCYGPRYGRAETASALAKIDEDFRGAKQHWRDAMASWVFVVNLYADRVPSELVRKVAELSAELGIPAAIYNRSDIIDLVESLSGEDRALLYGVAPRSTDMTRITYANIGRALATIRRSIAADSMDPVPLSATLAAKVKYNSLSNSTRHFLTIGQTGVPRVESYFADQADPEEGERMAQGFKLRYSACVADALEPDQIFAEMVKFAGGGTGESERDASALAIVTRFFVTCQIFEVPLEGEPA